ncbi:MAG: hypothetical protein AB7P03_10150 [Kofleriaceae bacterium]
MRVAILTAVLLAGCVGNIEDGGGTGPTSNDDPSDTDDPGDPPAPDTDNDPPPPPPPPADPLASLKEWTGCMTIENFEASNMALAWGNLATEANQKCSNCHGAGAEGFIASLDSAVFFKAITEQKDHLLKYFTIDATQTVVMNTTSFVNAGVTLPSHPRFNASTNAGMSALQEFYDLTLAAKMAGTCGPSKLLE